MGCPGTVRRLSETTAGDAEDEEAVDVLFTDGDAEVGNVLKFHGF